MKISKTLLVHCSRIVPRKGIASDNANALEGDIGIASDNAIGTGKRQDKKVTDTRL